MSKRLRSFCRRTIRRYLPLGKPVVRTICVTSFLSFGLFYFEDIDSVLYLKLVYAVLFFVVVSYCVTRNSKLSTFYGLVASTNLIIFLVQLYQMDYWLSWDIVDIFFLSYAIFLVAFLLNVPLSKLLCFLKLQKKCIGKSENDYRNLFSERRYDLNLIANYLRKYNVIGVESKWGDGKTFLFELLKEECKSKYFFVKIGVMSVTTDIVEKFILNEINHLLENENIFSLASQKINNLLSSQNSLSAVMDLLLKSNSYTNQIDILKRDVLKLSKKIVLVFEDIDRISDKDAICKIFSIAESLSCDYIKIVYQYNEDDLLAVLEKEKIYLEKYIPYTMKLTPISFRKVVKKLCKCGKYSNIEADDFEFLQQEILIPKEVSTRVEIENPICLQIPSFSIRKVIIFLDSVENYVSSQSGCDAKTKRTIILFYFIKHFLYDVYNKISEKEKFLDTKLFEWEGVFYSIKELLNDDYEKRNLWTLERNKQMLAILLLFDFEFEPILDANGGYSEN